MGVRNSAAEVAELRIASVIAHALAQICCPKYFRCHCLAQLMLGILAAVLGR